MKKIIFSTIVLLVSVAAFAQNEKFTAAMKKSLADMETSFKNPSDLITLANNFERIATAEKNQWLPYYYAAFCIVNNGFMETDKDKVDAIADRASLLIAKADSLSPNNSEISCIKSMIASCHMLVNPMQRWQEYGQESNSQMDAAMQQDPANPRPYYLKAQGLKNTPEQFGGGCKTAKPEMQKALDKYSTFRPANELSPDWGKAQTEQLLKQCQ